MAAVIGDGITATPDGPHWKKKRLTLQPHFGPRTIDSFLGAFARTGQDLADTLGKQGLVTRRFVHQTAMDATLKSLFLCLFSEEIQDHGLYADFREVSRIIGKSFWLPGGLMTSKLTPPGRRLARHLEKLDALVYGMIARRRALPQNGRPDDLLTALLLAGESPDSAYVGDDLLRDELVNFIFAGYETTAGMLGWSLLLLAAHPEIQDSLRIETELVGALKSREDFAACGKIRAVLDEVNRLYPPVWMMLRQASEDDSLVGKPVKSGTTVLLSPYLIHRSAPYWTEPDEFRPSRFGGGPPAPSLPYLPFGLGPRHCLGNHFALSEGIAILFHLVRDWKISPIGPMPKPEALLTLQPPASAEVLFSPP